MLIANIFSHSPHIFFIFYFVLTFAHAANTPPQFEGSTTFMITVGQPSAYTFTITDDSDNVVPMIEGGLPPNANLENDLAPDVL